MLAVSKNETIFQEIERLLIKEKSLFDWQRFHLWRLLTNYDAPIPNLEKLIAEAKSIATNHVSELEASQAIIFIGKHGNNTDREALIAGNFSAQQSFVIQRAVLIAIQELPSASREKFFSRAMQINSEHKQLVQFLTNLSKPDYGRKLRTERRCTPEPRQVTISIKRGVGLVRGRHTTFRLSGSDLDYE